MIDLNAELGVTIMKIITNLVYKINDNNIHTKIALIEYNIKILL